MSGETSSNDPSATTSAAGVPAGGVPESGLPATGVPASGVPDSGVPAGGVPAVELPRENVLRGFLLALLAIPAGVLLYMIIWNLGYIASIVGLVVAFVAFFLYRLGSSGRVSVKGGLVITAITLVTLALAFVTGEVWDYVAVVMVQTGLTAQEILATPGFVGYIVTDLTAPGVIGAVMGDAAMTFIFGILGCAGVIYNIFRSARAGATTPAI